MDRQDLNGYIRAMLVVLGIKNFTGDVKCSINSFGDWVVSVEFSGLNKKQIACLSTAATKINGNCVEVSLTPQYS